MSARAVRTLKVAKRTGVVVAATTAVVAEAVVAPTVGAASAASPGEASSAKVVRVVALSATSLVNRMGMWVLG
jgi:hypothetical protein